MIDGFILGDDGVGEDELPLSGFVASHFAVEDGFGIFWECHFEAECFLIPFGDHEGKRTLLDRGAIEPIFGAEGGWSDIVLIFMLDNIAEVARTKLWHSTLC